MINILSYEEFVNEAFKERAVNFKNKVGEAGIKTYKDTKERVLASDSYNKVKSNVSNLKNQAKSYGSLAAQKGKQALASGGQAAFNSILGRQ